jgi:hypothetical protein
LIQAYHHGRFEFFVAVIVIAIIALAALGRYSLMAEDARILRLEIISHHFMTGAANARVHFLLTHTANNNSDVQAFEFEGKTFYFSAQGWPVSVSGPVGDDYQPTEEDCYQLWMLLLQNPAPISKGNNYKNRSEYRVLTQANSCRYEFSDGAAYFDYYPLSGKIIFTSDIP